MLYRFMDEMAGAVDVDNYMLNRSMFHKLVLHGQTTSHLKNRKKKLVKALLSSCSNRRWQSFGMALILILLMWQRVCLPNKRTSSGLESRDRRTSFILEEASCWKWSMPNSLSLTYGADIKLEAFIFCYWVIRLVPFMVPRYVSCFPSISSAIKCFSISASSRTRMYITPASLYNRYMICNRLTSSRSL